MTTLLFEILGGIAEVLQELEKSWALVGGLAVSSYVEPRFTRDIDIAISAADDEEAEDFLRSWQAYGYTLDTIIEQDAVDRLATVRTYPSGQERSIVVDLLFASSGIEPEIGDEARQIEIVAGLTIPVARPGHLFALKLLAADRDERPQDELDLKHLAQIVVDEEREAARRAVRLIEERGFNRGRDLKAMLDAHLK